MFPLTLEQIDQLDKNSTSKLIDLDSKGILLAPGESLESFKERIKVTASTLKEIDEELDSKPQYELFQGVHVSKKDKIPASLMDNVSKTNKDKYGFSINWVPGFFLSKSLGLLWGGCSVSFPEEHFSAFLIRKSFTNKEKWLIYSRSELLSHELCHIARTPINDNAYEEHFAYAISKSNMRQQIGNCFQRQIDALIFLCPIFILLAAQIYQVITMNIFDMTAFWIIAMSGPSYLLIKNYYLRIKYFKAFKKLKRAGIKKRDAVLFRCTKDEIFEIGKTEDTKTLLSEKANSDLRWQIIAKRFINI